MTESTKLETERLILRTVRMADASAVACGWNLGGDPLSLDDARGQVVRMQSNHAKNQAGPFFHLCLAIFEKGREEIIGWCGLDHHDPDWPNPVLFYLLKEEAQARGLATEAAGAVLHYGLNQLGLPVIDAGTAPGNAASRRVLEKVGMRLLATGEDGSLKFRLTAAHLGGRKRSPGG